MALLPSVLTKGGSSLYDFSNFTFSNASVTGRSGPTLAQVQSAYSATAWTQNTAYLNMTTQGIQRWTVPATANYRIELCGAQGGTSSGGFGGFGAQMIGTFSLNQSNVVQILVGQRGLNATNSPGGGGGSFVVASDGTPLIIAGGGGGGERGGSTITGGASNATTSTTAFAASGVGGSGGPGGTNGQGGGRGSNTSTQGGAGGGLITNGQDGWTNGYAGGGLAFSNAGVGGVGWRGSVVTTAGLIAAPGGFGGGGGGEWSSWTGSGGGGGYSGGGGGSYYGYGGGGGSYNNGTNQSNTSGVWPGDGYVKITKL
jgi:hypothetical protein